MALRAGGVAVHALAQLRACPRARFAGVVLLPVHTVAAGAGQRTLALAADVARRGSDAVQFAAGHARQTVVPEGVRKELWVLLELAVQLGRTPVLRRDHELALRQFFARPERRAMVAPCVEVLLLDDRHRVALPTDLVAARARHTRWLGNGVVAGLATVVQAVAT